MKKIIFPTALLVFLTTTVFAGSNDANTKAVSELRSAMNKATDAKWTTAETYSKESFVVNGDQVSAIFDTENQLIGFTRTIKVNDLPQQSLDAIRSDLGECAISDAMMFIEANGKVNYYAGARSAKGYTAFQIMPKGKVREIGAIPAK